MKRPQFIHELNELEVTASIRYLTYEEAKRKSELKQKRDEYYRKKGK
jgi:hypothetical protein